MSPYIRLLLLPVNIVHKCTGLFKSREDVTMLLGGYWNSEDTKKALNALHTGGIVSGHCMKDIQRDELRATKGQISNIIIEAMLAPIDKVRRPRKCRDLSACYEAWDLNMCCLLSLTKAVGVRSRRSDCHDGLGHLERPILRSVQAVGTRQCRSLVRSGHTCMARDNEAQHDGVAVYSRRLHAAQTGQSEIQALTRCHHCSRSSVAGRLDGHVISFQIPQ